MKVLDTNIVIYLLEGRLAQPIAPEEICISVITEIELLSHGRLEQNAEKAIRMFLDAIRIVPLTNDVKDAAILLRRRHGLRIPDAVIAATATTLDAELFTNDANLAATPSLRCRTLDLKSA